MPKRVAKHSMTRRGLFRGLAVAGAAAATVSVLGGCKHDTTEPASEPMVVDSGDATNVLESYEEMDDKNLKDGSTWTIPLGCVLHEAEGEWVPVSRSGATASPMVRACAFSVKSGKLSDVVTKPVTDSATNVIYDVRCSDSVYAWVELDYLTHAWTLYGSGFSAGSLTGSTTTLWQADANYDPPSFACTGNSVIWQVMPATSGDKTTEHSFCYLWSVGGANAQSVVESPGRFATAPTVSPKDGTVTLTPRVRADEGVFYGITAYSLGDGMRTTVDQLVMPQTVRPFRAVRIGDRFCFSVEANYGSGGLFGNMGTYIGPSGGPFITLVREPAAGVAGKDGVYVIKSTASYFVVDTKNSKYTILAAANRCLSYGEFPARVGSVDDFVTFATVKTADTGYPDSVTVRSFDLELADIESDEKKDTNGDGVVDESDVQTDSDDGTGDSEDASAQGEEGSGGDTSGSDDDKAATGDGGDTAEGSDRQASAQER